VVSFSQNLFTFLIVLEKGSKKELDFQVLDKNCSVHESKDYFGCELT